MPWAEQPNSQGSVPVEERDFSLAQTGYGAHMFSYTMGPRGCFSRSKESVKLTNHLHLVGIYIHSSIHLDGM
jgi:hypothetical protein